MRSLRCLACLPALLLPILLSGCSYLFPTKRHLPVPIAPAAVQTVSPDDLVKQLNQHWDAMNTLTATVEIYATQTKTKEGVATDFPSCRGYILMRKPKMLRVLGKYFGVTIFDMVSDGSHFTLLIPHDNLAIEGANSISEKSTNPLLNLRPDFFLDAIAVRGLDSDNEYMVAGDTETIEDAAQKRLYIEPEYTLSVMRPKAGPEKLPLRVTMTCTTKTEILRRRSFTAPTQISAPAGIHPRSSSSGPTKESSWCSPSNASNRMSTCPTTSSSSRFLREQKFRR
jgi:hypothetical protein